MKSPFAQAAAASLLVLLAGGGCARLLDIHGPKTVSAGADGGAVTVRHGQRLRIPLAADPKGGFEWRRVEPPIMRVVLEGPPDENGLNFTPVRDGEEKLSFEYVPVAGERTAQRTVSYDITVR
jgi:hypothetical protein